MKPPILRKKKSVQTVHNTKLVDNYSWVHQENILEVLTNPKLLNKEVQKHLESENKYTQHILKAEKKNQNKLFKEIKGRIKLADETLPFIDKKYSYWTKTTKKGNYSIKLRKSLKTGKKEEIWNGNKENEKTKSSYFGIGDLTVSHNDKLLAYSLDLKGSEYYNIYLRKINNSKNLPDILEDTTGSILFTYDDKYIFYSKLDKNHRAKTIFLHKIGTSQKLDKLIYQEKIDRFSVSVYPTSDEKFFIISSGDYSTNKCYYLNSNLKSLKLNLFKDFKENITYSLDSWNGYFYNHTNDNAVDFKIERASHTSINKVKVFVPPKKDTIIGSYLILNDWFIWSETKNANQKIFIINFSSNIIKEIDFFKEPI